MKYWNVFKRDPPDDTNPYPKSFHPVESYMMCHHTDFDDDSEKIIWILGSSDEQAGMWYDDRAEYMIKFFNVDKWNGFISAMQEWLLDREEERKALEMMMELIY
jgi:hypothetical protein